MQGAIATGRIPGGQYHAVLIDEAHDFEPDWLRLAVSQCDPATNHLLVLYDDAQTLYGHQGSKQRGLGFSLKSVGIQASGCTTILHLNYRNTREILQVAYAFVQALSQSLPSPAPGKPTEATPEARIIAPTSAGRSGPMPELIPREMIAAEARWIAERMQVWREVHGWQWREMAILYRTRAIAQQLVGAMRYHRIPVEWVNQDRESRNRFDGTENSVKVLTLYASKGLEFRGVAIAGVGHLPDPREDPDTEARLLYVGMTRAMDELVLTYSQESVFVEAIRRVVQAGL